jgi:hypothetical protein
VTPKPLLWVEVSKSAWISHANANTNPYDTKAIAVGRSGCACGMQKVRVCWGGVGRRRCRVALVCVLSLKPFWAAWRCQLRGDIALLNLKEMALTVAMVLLQQMSVRKKLMSASPLQSYLTFSKNRSFPLAVAFYDLSARHARARSVPTTNRPWDISGGGRGGAFCSLKTPPGSLHQGPWG